MTIESRLPPVLSINTHGRKMNGTYKNAKKSQEAFRLLAVMKRVLIDVMSFIGRGSG